MPDEIKVCIYLELEGTLGKSGIGAAVRHQIRSLKNENVAISRNPYSLDYDILHINSIGPHSLFLANVAKAAGKKIILHAHTTGEDFINSYHFSEHMAPWLRRYLKLFYDLGDLVLCPTEYTKSLLENYGIAGEKIKVISNGVDVSRFENLEHPRDKYRKKYALHEITPFCVGHVFAKKGVKTFINLACQFPKQKFLWFGTIYEKLVQSNTLEMIKCAPANCFFTGYVKNILAAYAAGDIFVFPSYNENQGIVILEAAASKKPIIVRKLSAYSNLVDGKECIKAKSEEEFSQNLEYLIDNPKECTRLANNAYKMVKEHDLQKVGHTLAEIYKSV